MKSLARLGLFLLALGTVAAAEGDLAARLVILANSSQPESVALAHYYAERRGVPAANIIALPLPEGETISWHEFVDRVYQPMQDELYRRGWLEGMTTRLVDRYGRRRHAFSGHRISYLVTCRGVPLRIANDATLLPTPSHFTGPFNKNEAAVDSELSLLAWDEYEPAGPLANPLFSLRGPETMDARQVVKVCRLDGPTWDSARHLVVSALEGERTGLAGRYYIDLVGPHADGDQWLRQTATALDALGFAGEIENTSDTFPATKHLERPVFYFGWYAGDINGPFAEPGFMFPSGAIAMHIHSFSAQTLHSETTGWCGPLVAHGVAATLGNVFEPDLKFTHHPELLVRALGEGRTFGDAAYYALPALSWEAIAIGDPLYRPFAARAAR
jgi:uncharacterized protein (TIGR03790 family)